MVGSIEVEGVRGIEVEVRGTGRGSAVIEVGKVWGIEVEGSGVTGREGSWALMGQHHN